MASKSRRETGYRIGVAVFVFLSAWLGITLTGSGDRVSAIWLANGVLLTLLITKGNRSALPLLMVGFLANVMADRVAGHELLQSLALTSVNGLEVVIAYWLLTRKGRQVDLLDPRSLSRFALYGAVVAPLICAFIGSGILVSAHPGNYWRDCRTWFLADSLGIAITVPILFAIRRPQSVAELFSREKLRGTVAVMTLLLLCTIAVFDQSNLPLLFLIFPFLVLVAFTRGFGGSVLAVAILAIIGITNAVMGKGPVSIGTSGDFTLRVLLLQGFLACVIGTLFPLAAVLSDRDRLNQQLSSMVYNDALTGLPNRRHFDMRYNLEWRRAIRSDTPISIMMIDVDEFKRFNDFYGHQAGDQCLAAIGRALQGGVKRSADFVARYGGEEFVVLLPETATNGAEVVARHLLAAVKALKITHNQSSAGQVSVSIGIASLQPHFSDEPGVLLHAADAALYIAKREGRDQFRTAPESIATHE